MMRPIFFITAWLFLVALEAAPAAAFEVPPPPQGLVAPITLRTSLNKDCLQPLGSSKLQGVAIVQQVCGPNAANIWILSSGSGSGNFHVMNALSGLCLDARGAAANRTPVQQWVCNRISNEDWEVDGAAYVVNLKSRVSGTSSYCLDVPGGQRTPGLQMQIYSCNGTASQLWLINPSDVGVVPLAVGQDKTAAAAEVYVYGLTPDLEASKSITQCNAGNRGKVVGQTLASGSVQPKKAVVGLIYCP